MHVESDPESNRSDTSWTESDLELARAVASGSQIAWHDFLTRYSELISGVVRRHLVAEDDDDVRGVYVDILHALYKEELAKFRGDVHLSTWLIVYTRSRALDFFRKRHGRYRAPEGYEKLDDFDRRVLEFHLIKRLPMEVTLQLLAWRGTPATVDGIAESVGRIENVLDRRYLARVERQSQARVYGIDSVPMLKYINELQHEYETESGRNRPDVEVMEKESEERFARLRALVGRLSSQDREIVELRFGQGLSAKEIDQELHLGGQRRVYSMIDRIVRKLRRAMGPDRQL